MPVNRRNNQNNGNCDAWIWIILFYCTMSWWEQPQSRKFDWFFKSFTLVNYTLMLISKEYIAKNNFAHDYNAQCQFFGCITPIYICHTFAGSICLFRNFALSKTYPGYLSFVVFISLSYMILFLLIVMLCSIGIPNFIHYRRHGAVRNNPNNRDAAVDLLEDERDERVPN